MADGKTPSTPEGPAEASGDGLGDGLSDAGKEGKGWVRAEPLPGQKRWGWQPRLSADRGTATGWGVARRWLTIGNQGVSLWGFTHRTADAFLADQVDRVEKAHLAPFLSWKLAS